MRTLISGTNIEAPSSDYPKGRPRDLNGGAGTIINEVLIGDLIQFFQKLIITAGITENGLPDNVTNDYQLFQALESVVRSFTGNQVQAGCVGLANNTEALAGDDDILVITPYKNSYVNRTKYKIMSNGESYTVPVRYGRIFIPSTSSNCTVILPNPATFVGQEIIVNVSHSSVSNVAQYPAGTNIANLPALKRCRFISDGTVWWFDSQDINFGIACPFVYINGVYFDEILKNIINIDGEETLDISKSLIAGDNTIRISEEKQEITYLKELYFNDILLDSNVILKTGDYKKYNINYTEGKAELKAVGHYKYI